MNKQQLISRIAKEARLKRDEVEKLLAAFSETISETLSKGEKITIAGFGSFVLSQRKGRVGVNPRNPQEKINIPPTVTAHFKASKIFKNKLK